MNHSIEMGIFGHNKSQAIDIREDDEEEDKKDIDIFIADSYFYAVAITRMH